MHLRFFGGLAIDAGGSAVRGRGQEALLFRLAIDADTTVGYRALAEDVWPDDQPDDPRAALQSLVSRLRRTLPAGAIEAAAGGYRLAMSRADIDVTRFQDLVAHARALDPADPTAVESARAALALWIGEPWMPDGFDWVLRDLLEDRAHAERIARAALPGPVAAHPMIGTYPGPDPAPDPGPDGEPHAAPGTAPGAARDTAPGAVPAAITTLVGRGAELALIADQLAAERLVTLLGPGGAGKTTLALETARAHRGAVVVELAPAASGEVWAAIAGAVARSIRLSDTTANPTVDGPRDRALEALAGRSVLLVLDNCEHVSAEAAAVAVDLLRSVPGLRILATSREPLGVPGEAFADLGPLPDADAVELFGRRVRAARGSAPAEGDTELVARIVRRLDGLPLALELAAAKTRTLTLDEIDRGLDDRFALLASGPRTADPRHQTLRALIDWSWETLTDPERGALLGVAVFPDGVDATDVGAFASAFQTDAAALDQLVDRSLLRRTDGRFRMLETVREYGRDRLRASSEDEVFRTHQTEVILARSTERDALLRGPRVREALDWFDANDENISAALRACTDLPGLRDTGVRLVRASLWRWMMRERIDDLRRGIEDFANAEDPGPIEHEASVVVNAIALLYATMVAQLGRGTASADPAAASAFRTRAEPLIAGAHAHRSELSAAVPSLLEAAAAALEHQGAGAAWSTGFQLPEVDDSDVPAWTAALLNMLRAAMAQNSGDVALLGRESEKALRRFRELDDVWGIAFASQMRSEWLLLEGRLEEALEVADASTEGLAGLTAVSDLIQQRALGISVLSRLGRFDEARERLADIRAVAERDGSERAVFQGSFTAASLEIAAGDGEAALRELAVLPREVGPGEPEQVIAWGAAMRAQALVLTDRTEDARDELRVAVPLAMRSGDQPIIAEVVLALATWFAATGAEAEAHRALRASTSIRGAADKTNPTRARLIAMLSGSTSALTHGEAVPEMTLDTASSELEELMVLLER